MTSVVAAIIGREIELVSQFIAVLNEEQEVLKRGDVAALSDLASRKTPLVEQLNNIERERTNALDLPESANERGAMENWLARNGNDADTTVNWKKLLNLASEAKRLHELNVQLLEMHLRQTSEILSILTSQPGKNTLYGSTGQTLSSTGSRFVDSA